ncbi:hypothetical protein LVD13_12115 [Flavobacteriaceae bacterium D16]|nr:hypothetical protein [Flavobacteriaceae bacterium D16]
MRLLFLILLFLPVDNCKDKPNLSNDINKLIYKVSSRGYYRYIEIDKNQINVSDNKEMDNPSSGEISLETWQSLVLKLEDLKIENLSSLNTSTEESALDRSLVGELTVYVGQYTYSSPMFDHSNPPDELKGLISQMTALAETVE